MFRILEQFAIPEQGLMLVAPPEKAERHLFLLEENGFKNLLGYLEGGLEAWRQAGHKLDVLISLSAEEVRIDLKHALEKPDMLDIRTEASFAQEHVAGARNLPLKQLLEEWEALPIDKPCYVYCRDGVLSATVVSWLKLHGRPLVKHVFGGFEALKEEGAVMTKGPA